MIPAGNDFPFSSGTGRQNKADTRRLSTQMDRLKKHMLEASARGRWLTLTEIRAALEESWRCPFPEASISAQLRHLKKPAFGAHRLEKRRRYGAGFGLFEYRLLSPDRPATARPRTEQQALFLTVGTRT